MARPSLRARLKRSAARIIIGIGIVTAVPATGYAAMAVIDTSALAALSQQLNALKQQIEAAFKQIEWLTKIREGLNEVSNLIQDQIDAIGAVGQITLPFLNLTKLTGQLHKDIRCLAPDLSGIMPNLDFADLDFGSICEGRQAYQRALWLEKKDDTDPTQTTSEPETWEEFKGRREEVQARREALAKDAATGGLAQADLAASKTADTNQRATEELESSAQAAKNQNQRLAVIAQGQVLINRQLVHQNQLLAQLLKVQSMALIMQSLPVADRPDLPEIDSLTGEDGS